MKSSSVHRWVLFHSSSLSVVWSHCSYHAQLGQDDKHTWEADDVAGVVGDVAGVDGTSASSEGHGHDHGHVNEDGDEIEA